MTPPPATPAPPKRKHPLLRRIALLVLTALLIGGGWMSWREYDFRAAIRQAREANITFSHDDPFETIRDDWRTAFQSATWNDGKHWLALHGDEQFRFAVKHDLFRRLRVKGASVIGLRDLQLLVHLHDAPQLRAFHCSGCETLTSLDALSGIQTLQTVAITSTPSLSDVRVLHTLPNLRRVVILDSPQISRETEAELSRKIRMVSISSQPLK
jgi:hypothetical protein